MAKIYVAKRVIDYVGLLARGIPEGTLAIDETMAPVLALLQGMGADGAKLVNVDANGNLLVSPAGAAALTPVNLTQLASAAFNSGHAAFDGNVPAPTLPATVFATAWNGGSWDRIRSASAVDMSNQSGLGAVLSALPGQWAAQSNAGIGAASSASRGAGGAGVRHVLTGYQLVISSQAAPAAGQVLINIRDGATGVGTILEAITVQIPAALYAPIMIMRSGLSLVGTAATAMTVEQSAAYAAVAASINFEGYDVA